MKSALHMTTPGITIKISQPKRQHLSLLSLRYVFDCFFYELNEAERMSEKMATIVLVVVTLLAIAGCISPNPMTRGQISHVGTSLV